MDRGATIDPFPIVTLPTTTELAPIHTLSLMVGYSARISPLLCTLCLVPITTPLKMVTFQPITAFEFITVPQPWVNQKSGPMLVFQLNSIPALLHASL